MLNVTFHLHVEPFFVAYRSKQTYYQVVGTSIWLISYSVGLCNKNCIFVSDMLIKRR